MSMKSLTKYPQDLVRLPRYPHVKGNQYLRSISKDIDAANTEMLDLPSPLCVAVIHYP